MLVVGVMRVVGGEGCMLEVRALRVGGERAECWK